MKKVCFILAICFSSFLCAKTIPTSHVHFKLAYNPEPYLIKNNHPLKTTLDSIFSSRTIVQDAESFKKAGFIILFSQKISGVTVAKHPKLPGYLFKLYLDSAHVRNRYSQAEWLTQRCVGAERLRKAINECGTKRFEVPCKSLYKLPPRDDALDTTSYVVVETYYDLVASKETRLAWKNLITKKDLQDLFYIMEHVGVSCYITKNTPYTKQNTFAFIDTEQPDRPVTKETLKIVCKYLSEENQAYWLSLIEHLNEH